MKKKPDGQKLFVIADMMAAIPAATHERWARLYMKKKPERLESDLEEKCRSYVRMCGGELLKFKSPSSNGVPDRIMLLPGGKIVFIEFKRNAKSVMQPLQPYWRERFTTLGQTVWTVWDYSTFTALVDRL